MFLPSFSFYEALFLEAIIDSLYIENTKEGNGNPLQYTCLGNPIDRGVW